MRGPEEAEGEAYPGPMQSELPDERAGARYPGPSGPGGRGMSNFLLKHMVNRGVCLLCIFYPSHKTLTRVRGAVPPRLPQFSPEPSPPQTEKGMREHLVSIENFPSAQRPKYRFAHFSFLLYTICQKAFTILCKILSKIGKNYKNLLNFLKF